MLQKFLESNHWIHHLPNFLAHLPPVKGNGSPCAACPGEADGASRLASLPEKGELRRGEAGAGGGGQEAQQAVWVPNRCGTRQGCSVWDTGMCRNSGVQS